MIQLRKLAFGSRANIAPGQYSYYTCAKIASKSLLSIGVVIRLSESKYNKFVRIHRRPYSFLPFFAVVNIILYIKGTFDLEIFCLQLFFKWFYRFPDPLNSILPKFEVNGVGIRQFSRIICGRFFMIFRPKIKESSK